MNKIGTKRPLYTLVQEELLELIREWDQTKPLPSETDLSKQMGVSRSTVREAIQNLEKSDILFKRQGVGTFINRQRASAVTALNNLHGIQNIVTSMGKKPGFKEQRINLIKPDKKILTALNLEKETSVIEVKQVYLADEIEIVLGISYINPDLYKNKHEDFIAKIKTHGDRGDSLFKIIDEETESGVEHAVAQIEAIEATPETSNALGVADSAPVLRLKETYYDKSGRAIMFSLDYIDTNRFELLVVRKRHF